MTNKRSRAIVAGHAEFAEGMLSAVRQIMGQNDTLIPFTNSGLSAVGIEQALRDVVNEHKAQVIFTDLPGGSCTIAASRLVRERDDVVLVTGTSLPMLLHWVTAGGGSDIPSEMVRGTVERATNSIRIVAGKPRDD